MSEEALGAGAAALSAALSEAMKEGHAKSVELQQSKLTCVCVCAYRHCCVVRAGGRMRCRPFGLVHLVKHSPPCVFHTTWTSPGHSTTNSGWELRWKT